MITVTVNNTKWSIPDRITIKEWVALQKWDITQESHWPYIIHEVIQIPVEELQDAEEESLQLFIGFMIGAINKRTLKHKPNFNTLNFGKFVDLDCFMSLGVEKHIDDILEILEVNTPWSDEALAIIELYIKWRSTIYKQYKTLFGLDDKDFDDIDTDEVRRFDPKDVSRAWYQVIVDLALDDVLKMDLITDEPLHKILTFLQIKKEKAVKEAFETRKIINKQR
tara:strand:- start:331 stop:999 length:669 start_codon:yes stop_codon:yes gene_type:complete